MMMRVVMLEVCGPLNFLKACRALSVLLPFGGEVRALYLCIHEGIPQQEFIKVDIALVGNGR
jgi:hypothetical protein